MANGKRGAAFHRLGKTRRCPGQVVLQPRPVEARPGVLFPAGRDVFVASDVGDRIALHQGTAQLAQPPVLVRLEGLSFQPFQFDAYRIVVAVAATPPLRSTRVPGACVGIDELKQLSVAADEEVRRHLDAADLLEVCLLYTSPSPRD